MDLLAKVLGERKFEIKYRWKVENIYTEWTTYEKFKTKKRLAEKFEELSMKSPDFVEYKVF